MPPGIFKPLEKRVSQVAGRLRAPYKPFEKGALRISCASGHLQAIRPQALKV